MQALIMAGGRGTRLSSVAKDIPKPMVRIGGKPLLEHQIENLKESGITEIILAVGYLGDVICEYFKDGSGISPSTGKPFGVGIDYFMEETPLGTAGALGKLTDRLDETFVLVLGDLFTDVSYRRFIEFHSEKHAAASLFIHPNSHPYDSDIVIIDGDNRVTGWSHKNSVRREFYKNLVNAGIYVLDRGVAEFVSAIQKSGREKVDLEKDVLIPLINREGSGIYGYVSTEYVKDLGTPERYDAVIHDVLKGLPRRRNLANKQKCVFLDRDGTVNKYVGYLRRSAQLELIPGAAEAICRLNHSDYLTAVITNQPVIARGECSFDELDGIHNKLHSLLGRNGAYLDALYYCPHHPDSGFDGEVKELKFDCDCRKPKIGMLKRAAEDLNVDLSDSWFVGDTYLDVQTGINAGMKTVLLLSGDQNKADKLNCKPDYIAEDLAGAVEIILKKQG